MTPTFSALTMCSEMPTGDVIPACPSQKLKREEPRIGQEGRSQRDSWRCGMAVKV